MKVKDLKEILDTCDDDMEVWFNREDEWVSLMKEDIAFDYQPYEDCEPGIYIGV